MSYTILPFNVDIVNNKHLLVGMAGDYIFLDDLQLHSFVNHRLDKNSDIYFDLKSKNFLADSSDNLCNAIDMTATRYRTKKGFLKEFTNLHMMVITVRCNQECKYCQVSCAGEDAKQYDMTSQVAYKIVDFIFQSPSNNIKIEFQGGESTLNWQTIVNTVIYAERKSKIFNKNIEFVICTNLTTNFTDKIDFIKDHNIVISTSLDGSKVVHDYYRTYKNGAGTYDTFLSNLYLLREKCNINNISALMTTTSYTLDKIKLVIDEYVKLGFDGIFLRAINPYGFADSNKTEIGYKVEKFIDMYKEALQYILELNKQGIYFVEYYTRLLLTRILTPFATGFVDLQSPSGAGISGVIYDYNGDVYPADEARMLARMGDRHFLMGNVSVDTYAQVFHSSILKDIVNNSCLEIMPICSNCVFMSYCGADPIRNYLETGDIIGDRIVSDFCKKNKAIFNIIFSYLDSGDKAIMDIFWSWIIHRKLNSNENH